MIIGTMPRRTFRIVNQKTTQQAENLRTMPLSSNRAESKTTLSNLGLEKKPQTALTLSFSPQKICFKNTSSSRTALTVQFTMVLGLLADKVRQHTRAAPANG
jgi:hypothetical protein